MTVAEYIEELKKMPQDLEMWFHDCEMGLFFPLGRGPREILDLKRSNRSVDGLALDLDPKDGKGEKKRVCHI
jgi:hypothetical protein